jgi:hypothetical protein
MPYTLRFTPLEITNYDLRAFTTSLDGRWVYNEEISKKGVKHFHLYVDGNQSRDTIVRAVYSHLGVKPGQKGKANAYFSLKPSDNIGYVIKEGWKDFFGYDFLSLQKIKLEWKEKHPKQLETNLEDDDENLQSKNKSVHKNHWQSILLASMDADKCEEKTVVQWTNWIFARDMKTTGLLSRGADAIRYARSLHIYYKCNRGDEWREELLAQMIEGHANFILNQEYKP